MFKHGVMIRKQRIDKKDKPYRQRTTRPRDNWGIDPEIPIRLAPPEPATEETSEIPIVLSIPEPVPQEDYAPIVEPEKIVEAPEGTIVEAIRMELINSPGVYYSSTDIAEALMESGLEGSKRSVAAKVSHALTKLREAEVNWLVFQKDDKRYLYRAIEAS